MNYKWDCPHHWLRKHLLKFTASNQPRLANEYLLRQMGKMAHTLECHQLQEIFEDEMEEDGYYKEKE